MSAACDGHGESRIEMRLGGTLNTLIKELKGEYASGWSLYFAAMGTVGDQ